MNTSKSLGAWMLALAVSLATSVTVAQPPHRHGEGPHEGPRYVRPVPPRPGYRYDLRYGHRHWYPPAGFALGVLPTGFVTVTHLHSRFFFADGVWYASRGPGFAVIAAPIGAFLPVLPVAYTTVWVGGLPYYYANDTYYEWNDAQHAYEVVDPPAGADEAPPEDADAGYQGQPGDAPPAAGGAQPQGGTAPGSDLYVYPINGQTEQQQSQDKWECHQWAVGQTGFDPTVSGGGVSRPDNGSKRAAYQRALTACLSGRGYSVK